MLNAVFNKEIVILKKGAMFQIIPFYHGIDGEIMYLPPWSCENQRFNTTRNR